jgi:NAD dependent epimerase/dehydratase family enzyme
MFGEMADAILLGGQRVVPAKAGELGLRFAHTHLDSALAHVLGG